MQGIRTSMHEVLDHSWLRSAPSLWQGWRKCWSGSYERTRGELKAVVYHRDGELRVVFHVERVFRHEDDAVAAANEVLEAVNR